MDEILVVGLNQKAACLELRERLAFNHEQVADAIATLANTLGETGGQLCKEAVLLSTCNRSEFYLSTSCPEQTKALIFHFLESRARLPLEVLQQALFVYQGEAAARHLLRVAAGLDSLVIGENEILGQVKDAFDTAHALGATGPVLSALFRFAVQAGKRTRTETDINKTGRSVATVVVDLAEEMFGCLSKRTALLVGAGKISALTARALREAGLRCILVANRTYERAVKLAGALDGQAVHFDALEDSLVQADIVICSTGAPHIVLHHEAVEKAMAQRSQRPLLVADLAVPRDADPSVAGLAGVCLADIDSLEGLVKKNHPVAAAVLLAAERIVEEELCAFHTWRQAYRSTPIIRALRDKAETICQEQVQQTLRRMGDLTPQQQRAVEAMGQAIIGKMLHDPITWLRQPPSDLSPSECAGIIQSLFGVAPEQN